ncbi:TPA: ATPase [Candidatus Delongbacteria bacterium]|nr:ATPase [Candidatus Delongbacteria bacterium]
MIERTIKNRIKSSFFKDKAIIIYGARQVGKTTLVNDLIADEPETSAYLNCDEPDIRESLSNVTSTKLKEIFGSKKIIFIDEAQRVKNIGLTLKIIVDTFKDLQVVATGSSALELSNSIMEPLTGRAFEYHLYPFSVEELSAKYSDLEFKRILENRMIYGNYPDIINYPDEAEKRLGMIANNYLYKDLLQYQNIKKSDVLEKLVRALALQIGSEVSFNELAAMLGVAKQTIEHYAKLLEQSFVIFRLTPFSRNLRSELTKKCKIYFYDTGIRNSLIKNFNPLDFRTDSGALWENYIISERIKKNSNSDKNLNIYFWRTLQRHEIDYIEEKNGVISGFEMKYSKNNFKIPAPFTQSYPGSPVKLVNKDNFRDFVTD